MLIYQRFRHNQPLKKQKNKTNPNGKNRLTKKHIKKPYNRITVVRKGVLKSAFRLYKNYFNGIKVIKFPQMTKAVFISSPKRGF